MPEGLQIFNPNSIVKMKNVHKDTELIEINKGIIHVKLKKDKEM